MGIAESCRKDWMKDEGFLGDDPNEKGDPKAALNCCHLGLIRTCVLG
jgi:hypothetical protein